MSDRPRGAAGPGAEGAAHPEGGTSPEAQRRARRLFARVLLVQAVTLAALWLLQAAYGG